MGAHRLFFASDIHGSDVAFRKLLNAGKVYRADAIVMGGDLTGKAIVLITKTGDGYRTRLFGNERLARTDAQLAELIKEIRRNGFYYQIGPQDEIQALAASQDEVERLAHEKMKDVLRGWLALAEARMRGTGIQLYMSPGNDDIPEVGGILDDSKFVINPDERIVPLFDRFEMVSVGKANMTPWNCPRDVPEPELRSILERLVAQLDPSKRVVFNFHAPPFGTNLDVAMQLDKDLRPVTKVGQPNLINVGSPSVRWAIEHVQPTLALHGHIHESKASNRIRSTMCLNPGSEYGEGVLRGALVTLSDSGELKNYLFTTG